VRRGTPLFKPSIFPLVNIVINENGAAFCALSHRFGVIRKEYMQMDQYLRSSSSSHFDLRAGARCACVYGSAAQGLSVSTKVETAEVTSLFRAHSSGSNVLLNLASAISAFSCTHLSTFSASRAVTKFAQKECTRRQRRRCAISIDFVESKSFLLTESHGKNLIPEAFKQACRLFFA
jgi:hypothetical protein